MRTYRLTVTATIEVTAENAAMARQVAIHAQVICPNSLAWRPGPHEKELTSAYLRKVNLTRTIKPRIAWTNR